MRLSGKFWLAKSKALQITDDTEVESSLTLFLKKHVRHNPSGVVAIIPSAIRSQPNSVEKQKLPQLGRTKLTEALEGDGM